MTSKQERRAKAEAKATVQATEIIEAAKAKVTGAAANPRRTRTLSAEHKALAPKVKEYREQGMAWWMIGFKLSLPGSADTVAAGKGGAAFARRIWVDSYGPIPKAAPRSPRGHSSEKNEDVKAIKKERKTDRVAKVRQGEAVLRLDMTDEEVVETLRGRVIGWTTDLTSMWPEHRRDNEEGVSRHMEQEAGVHKRWAKVEEQGGERCLVFKEFDPNAPIKYRAFAGSTRIVRLRTIHTVR